MATVTELTAEIVKLKHRVLILEIQAENRARADGHDLGFVTPSLSPESRDWLAEMRQAWMAIPNMQHS
jgi:hypothetical protein